MTKLADRLFIFEVVMLLAMGLVTGWLVGPKMWNAMRPYDWDKPIVVAAEEPRPTTYQVMPGDTLWGIASRYYPGHHTGEIVHEIRKANGLTEDATLYPYTMILKLPEVN